MKMEAVEATAVVTEEKDAEREKKAIAMAEEIAAAFKRQQKGKKSDKLSSNKEGRTTVSAKEKVKRSREERAAEREGRRAKTDKDKGGAWPADTPLPPPKRPTSTVDPVTVAHAQALADHTLRQQLLTSFRLNAATLIQQRKVRAEERARPSLERNSTIIRSQPPHLARRSRVSVTGDMIMAGRGGGVEWGGGAGTKEVAGNKRKQVFFRIKRIEGDEEWNSRVRMLLVARRVRERRQERELRYRQWRNEWDEEEEADENETASEAEAAANVAQERKRDDSATENAMDVSVVKQESHEADAAAGMKEEANDGVKVELDVSMDTSTDATASKQSSSPRAADATASPIAEAASPIVPPQLTALEKAEEELHKCETSVNDLNGRLLSYQSEKHQLFEALKHVLNDEKMSTKKATDEEEKKESKVDEEKDREDEDEMDDSQQQPMASGGKYRLMTEGGGGLQRGANSSMLLSSPRRAGGSSMMPVSPAKRSPIPHAAMDGRMRPSPSSSIFSPRMHAAAGGGGAGSGSLLPHHPPGPPPPASFASPTRRSAWDDFDAAVGQRSYMAARPNYPYGAQQRYLPSPNAPSHYHPPAAAAGPAVVHSSPSASPLSAAASSASAAGRAAGPGHSSYMLPSSSAWSRQPYPPAPPSYPHHPPSHSAYGSPASQQQRSYYADNKPAYTSVYHQPPNAPGGGLGGAAGGGGANSAYATSGSMGVVGGPIGAAGTGTTNSTSSSPSSSVGPSPPGSPSPSVFAGPGSPSFHWERSRYPSHHQPPANVYSQPPMSVSASASPQQLLPPPPPPPQPSSLYSSHSYAAHPGQTGAAMMQGGGGGVGAVGQQGGPAVSQQAGVYGYGGDRRFPSQYDHRRR